MADDLVKQQRKTAAAIPEHKRGRTAAKKLGSEHYRKITAARKTRGGGRPRKNPLVTVDNFRVRRHPGLSRQRNSNTVHFDGLPTPAVWMRKRSAVGRG